MKNKNEKNVRGKIQTVLKRRRSKEDIIFLVIVYASVLIITFSCLYPMYFTVIASFSKGSDVYLGKVNLLPSGFNLKAYIEVFENAEIWRGYSNSIFYTVAGTMVNLFLTIPTAYALSRKRMFGRGLFMTLFIITMYFGGGMIPTYLLYKNLGLTNTPWIMVISGGLSVYNVIVTRTYFQSSIPDGLYEAARIDGASEFVIFGRIMLPLSKPILAVITLYYAAGHWGSYFGAMIYLNDRKLYPLQLVLRNILVLNQSALEMMEGDTSGKLMMTLLERVELNHVMKFALVFISSAPMLVVYPFVQKYFIKGVMVGALKE